MTSRGCHIEQPGALITYTFLGLFDSFGIFPPMTGKTMGHRVQAAGPATSSQPPPHLMSKASTRQDLPKSPARDLVNPKGAIPFTSDNFISSANLPKESNPFIPFLKAQDDSITKIMSLGPEGRLLGFTCLGPFCAHWAERAVVASSQCPAFPS